MIYLHEFNSAFWIRAREVFSNLNWVDFIWIIIVIRTITIGLRKGLLIEIFKLSGLGVGIFAAVTHYPKWGGMLSEKTVLSLHVAEGFAFVVIFAMVYGALLLLRLLVVRIVAVQVRGAWDRIGGGALGFCRGCLWLILLEGTTLCLTPTTGYLAQSIRERSFFGPSLLAGGKITYQIANQVSTSFVIKKFEEILQEGSGSTRER